MVSVRVELKENSYDIMIGYEILEQLGGVLSPLKIGTDALVITHPVIRRYHGKKLALSLTRAGFSVNFFEVPAGETSKSAHRALDLLGKIAAYSPGKKIFIVALGGGVVGDLAGFVAAVYKRGIPYIQVPTTLLAQVDSAIGGKVAIDLPFGKNLVGAFYQPKLVFSDSALLSTLNRRQIKNGLAEAIKYGIISDRLFFEYIEQHAGELLAGDPKVLTEVVLNCSRIKAKVVMADEKETKGTRAMLNFGHTVGHAIEAANQYKDYHHGEAIALGMRVASEISRRLRLLAKEEEAHINKVLSDLGLPERIKKVSLRGIMKHMAYDKKFQGKENRFVLVAGIGSVKVMKGISRRVIEGSIKTCQ